MPNEDKQAFERVVTELEFIEPRYISMPSLHWFLLGRLLSKSVSKGEWASHQEVLIEELLGQIEEYLSDISTDAAKLMRRDEDAE